MIETDLDLVRALIRRPFGEQDQRVPQADKIVTRYICKFCGAGEDNNPERINHYEHCAYVVAKQRLTR